MISSHFLRLQENEDDSDDRVAWTPLSLSMTRPAQAGPDHPGCEVVINGIVERVENDRLGYEWKGYQPF